MAKPRSPAPLSRERAHSAAALRARASNERLPRGGVSRRGVRTVRGGGVRTSLRRVAGRGVSAGRLGSSRDRRDISWPFLLQVGRVAKQPVKKKKKTPTITLQPEPLAVRQLDVDAI